METIGGRLEIISPPDNSSEYTITIEIIDDEGTNNYGAVFTNCTHSNNNGIQTTDIGICGNNIVPHLKSSCSADALCNVSANGRNLLNCSCNVGYLGTGLICRSKYPGNLKLIWNS